MLDKKLFNFIILFYILACGFGLTIAIFQKANGFSFQNSSWPSLLSSYLFNYGTKFIFILIAIIFTKKYILNKFSLAVSLLFHTIISLFLSLYSSTFLLWYENYFMGYNHSFTIDTISERVSYGSNFNFFVYFTLITILYAFHYFQKQKDQELREVSLKAQLLDSKIKTLQSQLHPHFLFNALNDISSLMDINIEKSQDAIADLSDMLRKTLNIKDHKFISLKEELVILNKYLDIEKIRFADKLSYTINARKEILHEKTPPLILQPIVENSIKHGYSYNHDILNIVLEIFVDKEELVFKVSNNGQKLKQEGLVFGNGISNILERIETLYEGNYSFEIENQKGSGVINVIKIPRTP